MPRTGRREPADGRDARGRRVEAEAEAAPEAGRREAEPSPRAGRRAPPSRSAPPNEGRRGRRAPAADGRREPRPPSRRRTGRARPPSRSEHRRRPPRTYRGGGVVGRVSRVRRAAARPEPDLRRVPDRPPEARAHARRPDAGPATSIVDETGRAAGRGAYVCRTERLPRQGDHQGRPQPGAQDPAPGRTCATALAGSLSRHTHDDDDDRRRSPWPGVGAAPAAVAGPASRRVATARSRRSGVQTLDPRERGAIELPGTITVKELAELLGVNPADIIRELIKSGIFATINQLIDRDTASLVAGELGYEVAEAEARRRRRCGRGRRPGRPRRPRRSSSRRTIRRSSSRAPRS